MRSRRPLLVIVILGWGAFLTGCDSGARSLYVKPTIDSPSKSSNRAFDTYDANKDGYLAGDELSACPGLFASLGRIDADGDKRLSSNELEARFDQWLRSDIGLVSFACRVTVNGRSLEGAEVKLVPEDFLVPSVKAAVGYTDSRGNATISLPAGDLPPGHETRRVIQPGIYKVQITHPRVKLPPRYNNKTVLGCEVAFDANRIDVPEFKLKTP